MIPLTIISGYLGSGKTTLINQLLKEAKKPIGVLVNDFGELNIDEELINNEDSLTISLSNGCVCCKLNDDLGISLEQMKELNVEAVVIEASGVAIPIKIANYGLSWPGFRLLGILSLVKGKSLKHLLSDKFVSKTVKAQITQADRVLLNRFEQEEKDVLSELTEDYLTEEEVGSYWNLLFKEMAASSRPEITEDNHHSIFQSFVLETEKLVNIERLERYLNNNTSIERAKGWVRDEQGKTWLLQMTRNDCNFSISNYETATRMVLVHTKDLDIKSLEPVYA